MRSLGWTQGGGGDRPKMEPLPVGNSIAGEGRCDIGPRQEADPRGLPGEGGGQAVLCMSPCPTVRL